MQDNEWVSIDMKWLKYLAMDCGTGFQRQVLDGMECKWTGRHTSL